MPSYSDAPELSTLGDKLIKDHHPDLVSINVGYLFRDVASMSRGRITCGMALKVDDRNHVFSGKDVMIEIARDVWDRLDDELRDVLLDHELNHIGVELDEKGNTIMTNNGRPKVFIKPHDFEEFRAVMDRYGSVHERFRKALEGMESVANSGKQA